MLIPVLEPPLVPACVARSREGDSQSERGLIINGLFLA